MSDETTREPEDRAPEPAQPGPVQPPAALEAPVALGAPADVPDPTPPARFRWRGYPSVPLTEAPLGVWGALGIAALTTVLVAAEHAFVVSPTIHAALIRFVQNLAPSASGRAALAAILSGLIGVTAYALTLVPVLIVVRRQGVRLRDAVGLRRFRAWPAIGMAALTVTVGFWFTTLFVGLVLQLGVHVQSNASRAIQRYHSSPVGVLVLVALLVVIGPIVEETVFRGVVFASLRESWGETPAILVSSLLFGIAHLDLVALIPTALIGVLLARTYSSTRSLWASILCHAAYNGFVLFVGLAILGFPR